MSSEPSVHRLGPQRNPEIDVAVLSAARRLLVERGFAGTSIEAIAQAAGVGRPAIYRRWPSKAHLVHEAIYPVLDQPAESHVGVPEQTRTLIDGAVALFGDAATRAAVPGLISETRADPLLREALVTRQLDPIRAELARRVLEGVDAGVLRAGVDADALLDVIAGAAIFALCVRDEQDPEALAAAIADIVLHGILPR
ncbi:TetR/AcrR family transcriptional regulator [Tomitella biformata]|uniref:TetR/AcrR family transcriptional regulator n=1 Tax=Tomitella biformata TaxID=630403 RepID=UPI0004634271|nr:TetR/AcrR family transcriptional regulator [Tomitella biformata]